MKIAPTARPFTDVIVGVEHGSGEKTAPESMPKLGASRLSIIWLGRFSKDRDLLRYSRCSSSVAFTAKSRPFPEICGFLTRRLDSARAPESARVFSLAYWSAGNSRASTVLCETSGCFLKGAALACSAGRPATSKLQNTGSQARTRVANWNLCFTFYARSGSQQG